MVNKRTLNGLKNLIYVKSFLIKRKTIQDHIIMENLSDVPFSSLEKDISERTMKAINDIGFDKMTHVQAKAIPPLLDGRDAVVCAKTGSGKTLAFLIPAVELLYTLEFKLRNGTGVIILSPTRELAMQTFKTAKELLKYHSFTCNIIMGGVERKKEAEKLATGINILVATPGKLLHHLKETKGFLFKNLQCLILDEADRLLDMGFEDEIQAILSILPKFRQTLLLSATITKRSDDLRRMAITENQERKPFEMGIENSENVTNVNLKQGYLECPTEKKFCLLYTILRLKRKKKVVVFFGSCDSVQFHYDVLRRMEDYLEEKLAHIHGKMRQDDRTKELRKFCRMETGYLLGTDIAARGLDIPNVDFILQYDPPANPKEYIHRVGRTVRGLNKDGEACLLLEPHEVKFVKYLHRAGAPLVSMQFKWDKLNDVQEKLQEVVIGNYYLRHCAIQAYKGYIRSYRSHYMKKIFNEENLNFEAVAKNYGFSRPPVHNV